MQFPPAPQQPTPYTPVGGAAPVAQELQGFGRGNDSMLVHMTPGEVGGLQQLAQQYGGSLTTNPQTGLPEAGFLESILPMIAGGLLTMTGIGAPLAAAMVGGGTGLLTGDLKQGLMAGLGAFGGAGLAGALTAGAGAAGHAGASAAMNAANTGAGVAGHTGASLAGQAAGVGTNALGSAGAAGASAASSPALAAIAPHLNPAVAQMAAAPAASTATHGVARMAATGAGQNAVGSALAQGVGQNAAIQAAAQPNMLTQMLGPKVGEFGSKFGNELAIQGVPRAATTGAGAMGVAMPLLNAMGPGPMELPKEEEYNYEGPYRPTDRQVRFRGPGADLNDTSEFSYFADTNPDPGFGPAPRGYAQGGPVVEMGPSLLPGQQSYNPPVDLSRFGAPPTLGGSPVNSEGVPLGMLTSGPGAAASPDRALRRPGSEYKAGMQAEHNWNFKPMQQSAGPMGGPGMDYMGGAGMDYMGGYGTSSISPMNSPKGLGALIEASRARDAAKRMPRARGPQYDAFAQREDGTQYFARGGVALKDGAFVMDARTVSEMGNGSSGAGQELLARHGGKPIKGAGDGVSDSIPARVGKQPARVARDEVKFDPGAVRRIGDGDPRRGAQRLYALMDKAHKARRTAGRGSDTKLRKAL